MYFRLVRDERQVFSVPRMQACIITINRVERTGGEGHDSYRTESLAGNPLSRGPGRRALACATAQGMILASSGLALRRRLF
jgi:hypothetical protein